MTKDDQDLVKAGIWCGAMFGLWILSTSLLLARLEKKIDQVGADVNCITYKVTEQLGKPYKGGIALNCLEEEVKE